MVKCFWYLYDMISLLMWLHLLNHLALLTAYYDVINNSYVTWLVTTHSIQLIGAETDRQIQRVRDSCSIYWSPTLSRSVGLENKCSCPRNLCDIILCALCKFPQGPRLLNWYFYLLCFIGNDLPAHAHTEAPHSVGVWSLKISAHVLGICDE